jgi:glycosyltransferase involved in cell wall biosynthesis
LGTWDRKVDAFIALTEFARRKFIEGGLPAEKVALKPNFLHPDPGPSEASHDYALFVGRLSPEKGIDTLLAAWRKLADKATLRIVGAGPLSPQVEAASSQSEGVEYLGHRPGPEVMELIAGARFLAVPSIWYEAFGLVIVEAFAKAKPVIASRLGAMTEIIEEGRTGLLFEPGDPDDLAAKVNWAMEHPAEMRAMGQNARELYLQNFTARHNRRAQFPLVAPTEPVAGRCLAAQRHDSPGHGLPSLFAGDLLPAGRAEALAHRGIAGESRYGFG